MTAFNKVFGHVKCALVILNDTTYEKRVLLVRGIVNKTAYIFRPLVTLEFGLVELKLLDAPFFYPIKYQTRNLYLQILVGRYGLFRSFISHVPPLIVLHLMVGVNLGKPVALSDGGLVECRLGLERGQ